MLLGFGMLGFSFIWERHIKLVQGCEGLCRIIFWDIMYYYVVFYILLGAVCHIYMAHIAVIRLMWQVDIAAKQQTGSNGLGWLCIVLRIQLSHWAS